MPHAERTQKLLFCDLLVSNDLEYSDAHLIVDAQSTQTGRDPMGPAELLHIPGLDISAEEAMHVADTLEDFFNEPASEYVACPVCGGDAIGTVEEVGQFLHAHVAFHAFEFNSQPMIRFGEGEETTGDSE